ncbi:MAG: YciI family protein [Ilumatobacter sp.]|uniref:YciI family protein n=1 Tax=Ilumatobacter sp. TaxID=1967498 RepID=UPI00260C6794|nr:YciI family protein [Ilumatobacter sp.]MDJ0769977.1 YciI family protein [Ilumatobacter sp.]
MLFVFHGLDHPGSIDLRRETRSAHLAHHSSRRHPVGGPLLDGDGEPCGTLIIFEADTLADAEAFIADDPYVLAGLFGSTTVRAFEAVDWPT